MYIYIYHLFDLICLIDVIEVILAGSFQLVSGVLMFSYHWLVFSPLRVRLWDLFQMA